MNQKTPDEPQEVANLATRDPETIHAGLQLIRAFTAHAVTCDRCKALPADNPSGSIIMEAGCPDGWELVADLGALMAQQSN